MQEHAAELFYLDMFGLVELIANQRVTHTRKMDTNLVGAAGVDDDFQDGCGRIFADDFITGGGGAAGTVGAGSHVTWTRERARNRQIDFADFTRQRAMHHTGVFFVDGVILKLFFEMLEHGLCARDNHQPGNFAVETVHDAGTECVIAYTDQFWIAGQQRVDERVIFRMRG